MAKRTYNPNAEPGALPPTLPWHLCKILARSKFLLEGPSLPVRCHGGSVYLGSSSSHQRSLPLPIYLKNQGFKSKQTSKPFTLSTISGAMFLGKPPKPEALANPKSRTPPLPPPTPRPPLRSAPLRPGCGAGAEGLGAVQVAGGEEAQLQLGLARRRSRCVARVAAEGVLGRGGWLFFWVWFPTCLQESGGRFGGLDWSQVVGSVVVWLFKSKGSKSPKFPHMPQPQAW